MKAKVSGLRKSNKCSCAKRKVTARSCNTRRGTFAPLIRKAKPQKKVAVIGLDVNLKTNVEEGYMMAQYDPRKKFTLDSDIKLIQYYPAYVREEMEERGLSILQLLLVRYGVIIWHIKSRLIVLRILNSRI